MIDRQVVGGVGVALVARAPVPVLTTPGAEDTGAEALPDPRTVQSVVAAAVRLTSVLGAATARAARQYGADRAELQRRPCPRAVPYLTLVTLECTPVDIAMSVVEQGGAVYSPAVLHLGTRLRSPISPR